MTEYFQITVVSHYPGYPWLVCVMNYLIPVNGFTLLAPKGATGHVLENVFDAFDLSVTDLLQIQDK